MNDFGIVIHGGAQNKPRSEMSKERELEYRQGLEEALRAGWNLLSDNKSALDAVEESVRMLENNSLFNAGRGSVLNEQGEFEFDAAIMCGKTLKAGAVASVKHIKNPVSLARAVMDHSRHVFLCGRGAEEFAGKHEIETNSFEYFLNPEKKDEWEKTKARELEAKTHDTVGAVALDKQGNLAAAGSTGGLTNKSSGRIGDTPIIGAGLYANNQVCAVACSGEGEQIIRGVFAHELYALMKYKNLTLQEAAGELMELNAGFIKAEMGLIAMDNKANIEIVFNNLPMYRAYKKNNDPIYIAVWEK